MQNNNEKPRADLKKRTYLYAINMIKFIDGLDKVEAQAGSTKRDFTNFFSYALKSANESKFWLGLLRDSGKSDKVDNLLQETIELANILGSSILTLKGKNKF